MDAISPIINSFGEKLISNNKSGAAASIGAFNPENMPAAHGVGFEFFSVKIQFTHYD
ncbi:hypothetical protein [Shewanella indica]|uniref:hypothetical protein n=1 Tax=Shewanella indica TaxID=768528 RepID=UPI00399B9876